MTLPKKTSRSIEVEGRRYRWMVRPAKAADKPTLRLTVESEVSGELLQRDFPAVVGKDSKGNPRANTVTPADVKEFIYERFL